MKGEESKAYKSVDGSRKARWSQDMEYGVPQKSELKQWPRDMSGSMLNYDRPGYNNEVLAEAHRKIGNQSLQDKAMYV